MAGESLLPEVSAGGGGQPDSLRTKQVLSLRVPTQPSSAAAAGTRGVFSASQWEALIPPPLFLFGVESERAALQLLPFPTSEEKGCVRMGLYSSLLEDSLPLQSAPPPRLNS